MPRLTLPSPAKINRFLHIVGQREDGYHLLQTGFQFLDYGDTLHFETTQTGTIELHGNAPIQPTSNLIYKAALALKPLAAPSCGVKITFEKRIPIGGGLGGGSSNAATTLIALNHLWNLQQDRPTLQSIGSRLGADVPIFIFGHSAIGEGIGDQLTPYSPPEEPLLIVLPPVCVISKELYCDKYLTRDTKLLKLEQLSGSESDLKNDFEPLVRKRYPLVDFSFQWLSSYGQPRLSGSGAAVFMSCPSLAEAKQWLALLPSPLAGFVATGRNRSPLQL